MAEAVAMLGVVAAGLQCAQVGVQLLMSASSLCSRLQDAPEKVKSWLVQIAQLVVLAELMKTISTDPLLSSLPLLPAASPSSIETSVSWAESALLDCMNQAHALQDVLKDMLEDVNDGKGQKTWKKLLTVKRDSKITDSLHTIERQKSMLNIWLGQINLRRLASLHHTVNHIQDTVVRVDGRVAHNAKTVREEVQTMSKAIDDNSRRSVSALESIRNLETSNVKTFGQQIQEHHAEVVLESSGT